MTQPPIKLSREAFEKFITNDLGYLVTRRGEFYDSSHTNICWKTWQAALDYSYKHPDSKCVHGKPQHMDCQNCFTPDEPHTENGSGAHDDPKTLDTNNTN